MSRATHSHSRSRMRECAHARAHTHVFTHACTRALSLASFPLVSSLAPSRMHMSAKKTNPISKESKGRKGGGGGWKSLRVQEDNARVVQAFNTTSSLIQSSWDAVSHAQTHTFEIWIVVCIAMVRLCMFARARAQARAFACAGDGPHVAGGHRGSNLRDTV